MSFESTTEISLKIKLNLTVFPFFLYMNFPLTIILSAKTPAAIFVNKLLFWKRKEPGKKANDGQGEVKPKERRKRGRGMGGGEERGENSKLLGSCSLRFSPW